MGYLKLAKLIGGAALAGGLIWLGAMINGWRLSGKVEKLEGQLTAVTDQREVCLRALDHSENFLEELRGAVDSANTQIAKFQQQADDLEGRLKATTGDLLIERAEYERRLAELSKPLPSDCQEAVREMARRLGAP